MIVRMPDEWNAIRDDFNQGEKDKLNAAISAEIICPRGVVVDREKLGPELRAKLTNSLKEARKRTNQKRGE